MNSSRIRAILMGMPAPAKPRILVVEDDPKTASLLRLYLEHAGYQVVMASDGREGLRLAREEPLPALVVLDVMLPHVDGLRVCREIRLATDAAVIFLTARSAEEDRLGGLDLGADDYVTKPFRPRELVARVRAVLRRRAQPEGTVEAAGAAGTRPRRPSSPRATVEEEAVIRVGTMEVDPPRRGVRIAGRSIDLTRREFDLLHALARRPGRVYSRDDLAAAAFGDEYEGSGRTIDAHVKNLRAKIEANPASPAIVLTVFGVGYRLAEADADA
jgi:DNA-binding response OmpR family regulator